MVNKKQIEDEKLLKFFEIKALDGSDKLFEPAYRKQLENKNFYPEYRKLCKDLRKVK